MLPLVVGGELYDVRQREVRYESEDSIGCTEFIGTTIEELASRRGGRWKKREGRVMRCQRVLLVANALHTRRRTPPGGREHKRTGDEIERDVRRMGKLSCRLNADRAGHKRP